VLAQNPFCQFETRWVQPSLIFEFGRMRPGARIIAFLLGVPLGGYIAVYPAIAADEHMME
jgi:hypothetical protein